MCIYSLRRVKVYVSHNNETWVTSTKHGRSNFVDAQSMVIGGYQT